MEVGTCIIFLRKQRNLKAVQLANKAGISTGYLTDIEKNTKKPTIDMLEKLCSALDLTLSEFFFDLPPEIKELVSECKEQPPEKVKVLIASAKAMK